MNNLQIYSATGTYELSFDAQISGLEGVIEKASAFVIDEKVLGLYGEKLSLPDDRLIVIPVGEEIKTPFTCLDICEQMLLKGVSREGYIVAIGGGVIQDLVTFAASIYMRGIKWYFLPTTLLAQADSCIGGKSSINFKSWKNILGNFYEPEKIFIFTEFLQTLTDDEIRSGIGEIFKVYLLSGRESAAKLEAEMRSLEGDPGVLDNLILGALELKNRILKVDALDKGLRLKMNYGHSFGHALEAATDFQIPHGIAVTIGLDVANYFSLQLGLISQETFDKFHTILIQNMQDDDFVDFEFPRFIHALEKDKKNKQGQYGLIVPVSEGEVELRFFDMNEEVNKLISNYFDTFYGISHL